MNQLCHRIFKAIANRRFKGIFFIKKLTNALRTIPKFDLIKNPIQLLRFFPN